MKIVKLESFLANCGLRNYLFVRLSTDTGLSGVGEATLEWQEMAVLTLLHEWAQERILDVCPFDIEQVFGNLIRDGRYLLPDAPGLGITLDDKACARHPFVKHAFPSLWNRRWVAEFTKAAPARRRPARKDRT